MPTADNRHNTSKPVTVVAARLPKPGKEQELEELIAGMTQVASRYPGHLGANIFRPSSSDDPEYRIIFKFDSMDNFRAWERSPEREEWLRRMAEVSVKVPELEVLCGLETWFELPGQKVVPPPPRYKMAIIVWLTLFPLTMGLSQMLSQVMTGSFVLRSLVMTTLMVILMTWVIMPLLTRVFQRWLYPRAGGRLTVHRPEA